MDDKENLKPSWIENKLESDFVFGRTFKHSRVLAYVSWGTVFGMIWLLLFEIIPLNPVAWGFWAFSLVVAFISSSWASK